jgi:4-hydroxybenzoate polyprenyltransferase
MSVLYSHPKFRFKTKFGLDLVINGLGYGTLNVLGGWFCSTSEITLKIILFSIIVFFIVSTGHPLTQIFQYNEDNKKDSKTFVAIFGPKKSLLISLLFLIITLILCNGFLLLYYSLLSNFIISFILFIGIGCIYVWYRNFGTEKDIKIMGNRTTPYIAYSSLIIGFTVLNFFILLG